MRTTDQLFCCGSIILIILIILIYWIPIIFPAILILILFSWQSFEWNILASFFALILECEITNISQGAAKWYLNQYQGFIATVILLGVYGFIYLIAKSMISAKFAITMLNAWAILNAVCIVCQPKTPYYQWLRISYFIDYMNCCFANYFTVQKIFSWIFWFISYGIQFLVLYLCFFKADYIIRELQKNLNKGKKKLSLDQYIQLMKQEKRFLLQTFLILFVEECIYIFFWKDEYIWEFLNIIFLSFFLTEFYFLTSEQFKNNDYRFEYKGFSYASSFVGIMIFNQMIKFLIN